MSDDECIRRERKKSQNGNPIRRRRRSWSDKAIGVKATSVSSLLAEIQWMYREHREARDCTLLTALTSASYSAALMSLNDVY